MSGFFSKIKQLLGSDSVRSPSAFSDFEDRPFPRDWRPGPQPTRDVVYELEMSELRDNLEYFGKDEAEIGHVKSLESFIAGTSNDRTDLNNLTVREVAIVINHLLATFIPKIPSRDWKRVIDLSRGDVHLGFGHAEEPVFLVLREDSEPWAPSSLYEWFVTRQGDWVLRLFDARSRDSHGYEKFYDPIHFVKVNSKDHGGVLGLLAVTYQAMAGNVMPDDRDELRFRYGRLRQLLE